MTQTVTYMPWWFVSPEACKWLPGPKSLIETLEAAGFAVDVPGPPWQNGGSASAIVPGSLEDITASLATRLRAVEYVLTEGGSANFVVIAGLHHRLALKALVADPFAVAPATLHALGMDDLAESARLAFSLERGAGPLRQYLAPAMPGASDAQIAQMAEKLSPDLNWEAVVASAEIVAEANLLSSSVATQTPILFLDYEVAFPGLVDRDTIARILPTAEIRGGEPADIRSAAAGHRRAEAAIDFFRRHGAS